MAFKIIPVKICHTEQNQSGEWLEPMGVVLHETATLNATDDAEFAYFNKVNRGANAHEFVSYNSISQFIALNQVGWHAGWKANHRYIGIEMCNFGDDMEKNGMVWQLTVGRIASLFIEHGWKLHFEENDLNSTFVTHNWVTNHLGGTTHVDPTAFLAKFGCTFQDFYNDVEAAIAELSAAPVEATPVVTPAEKIIEVWVQGVNVTNGTVEGVLKEDGRTYVPVRLVADALSAPVGWDDGAKKIIVNGTVINSSFLRGEVGYAWARELADSLHSVLKWNAEQLAVSFS